jgi:glyoxylase-like metal-dependent hydrolase (beta-lactamase superfamily II)
MEPIVTVRIGDIEITPVWDGTLVAGLDGIRGLDPATVSRLIQDAKQSTGVDPLVLPVRAFLVRDSDRLALVDTGSGTTKGPSMGFLPQSLAALGVSPADIDTVVMTHLHMDHIGGLVDASGKPAFKAATLVIPSTEARYFLDLDPAQVDARSRRHLDITRAFVGAYGNKVRRAAEGETVAGLTARLAPGHTPGHTVWSANSGGRQATILGDVVHLSAIQLPQPDAAMIYDVDQELASRTRATLLGHLADQRTLVLGAHLPAPGVGLIQRAGEGYRFVPMPPPD